ncbi:MAG: hypothetical protein NTY53_09370 [Kiritimatiellaeota bacterium]|nr:hypothetical protein [Kiritimatiellota bacterium]
MKNKLTIVTALFACTAAASAVELPKIPADSIAVKKELLFSDDFQGATPSPLWHKVVPTFAVEDGALKGTQTRDKNILDASGKVKVKAHAAVHGLMLPTKDSVVEVKVKLAGASMIDVEFDDRAYTNSHYGHICRAQIRTNGVTIIDERDGSMRNDIHEMATDKTKQAERAKLLVGRQATFPAKFAADVWHTLVVETIGDAMRMTVDDKPSGYLKSSGIGHPTKSKIELGVAGKDGYFDDLKVWNAGPAK